MKWLGVLRKNGVTEVKPCWKREDIKRLEHAPGVAEVFGPFASDSYLTAKLRLRAIAAAVGFVITPNGVLQK